MSRSASTGQRQPTGAPRPLAPFPVMTLVYYAVSLLLLLLSHKPAVADARPGKLSSRGISDVVFKQAQTCCLWCNYESSCCCPPGGSVVTKVQYTTRTRTISTITIRTTKVIATATRTVTDVFDYNRRGLTRRAAEVGNVAAADVLSPSADYVSSSDRQSLVQTEWISKHGLQKRHVCPVCPAGKTILPAVSNLGRTSADAALSYCCKLAKTVTRHKTRTTNVGKRTTLTVSTTRTITVTTDAKLGVWGYIHNGERPYEARSIVVTEQRPVIAKQQGRNHVVVANTTTNADGLFSVLIPRPPRGTNISIADAAHPQSPWITKQYTNQTEKFFNVIVPADQMPPPYTSTTTKTTTVTTTTCDCSIPTPWPYNPPRPVLMPP